MAHKYNIVIGYSAGGLKSLKTFFEYTPLDSAAYFVLQHLPMHHASYLKDILQRHSVLSVKTAEDGMPIQNNTIYILPRGKYMRIRDQRLYLLRRNEHVPNRAFDIFLDSVKENKTKNVIVLVLSGAGTDGSKGIAGIRELGGKVIAQSPDTCEFDSIPCSAIDTGLVDYVASPEEMPELVHRKIISEMK